ncbi:hypothetical protein SAMN05421770_10883 [Granulicella rosea]|uniref:Esterase n=1 Tax=Granulicella rosea TaxID=474952 RepID=A0A239M0A0_9BACT|nr:hypothetical protein [Granulicella rosea]SNT35558.1 hypothetical protein SAMN05421770_10883 [Granulicella rosea]
MRICFKFVLLLLLTGAPLLAASTPSYTQPEATVWQYSVPLEQGTERRAYLWIPPACSHVRGVLFGLQNMLERPMLEDATIREAVADANMAIVWVSPGAWPGKLDVPEQPSLKFSPQADAIAGVQHVLTALAKESGYSELEFAPLLVTGHSAAGPFVWGMASALPDRVFAALPYKNTIFKEFSPIGVPTLYVSQEWAEWGKQWGEVWHKELVLGKELRTREPHTLYGDFVDVGAGHFDWRHDSATVLAMFIRKSAHYRLPEQAAENRSVTLKPISLQSGVLVDPDTLGAARYRAIPYGEWKGDKASAFWYYDREMAEAINRYMLAGLSRKPQAIDFIVDGHPVPLLENGFAPLRPQFLADGVTFRVHAESLDVSPSAALYGGAALGHATNPITYRVSSGALRQVGPDTFQVAMRAGGVKRQGMPWEPWLMAVQPGDAQYRSTDKPAHILIDIFNTKGEPQTLKFAKIDDVKQGTREVGLAASASSGLPVQFYVESGPAFVDGNVLRLLPIPVKSRYPVKVIVSAFQWGRVGSNAVQSAGPQTQEFSIVR